MGQSERDSRPLQRRPVNRRLRANLIGTDCSRRSTYGAGNGDWDGSSASVPIGHDSHAYDGRSIVGEVVSQTGIAVAG